MCRHVFGCAVRFCSFVRLATTPNSDTADSQRITLTMPGRKNESDGKRRISKQACWHACIFPCMHACKEICMHASMFAYLSFSSYYISFRALHQHVLTGARRGWYASKHSGMHGFFLACMHAEKLPCMPACLLSYHPLFTPCNMQRGTMSCVHVVGSSLGLRSGG